MQELWRLDIPALTSLIHAKQVSTREVVETALWRLSAVNPHVNAVVEVLADELRASIEELAEAAGASAPPPPPKGTGKRGSRAPARAAR